MKTLLILPVLLPLLVACAQILAWRSTFLQRVMGVAGCAGMVAAAAGVMRLVLDTGVAATQAGDWPAPYGITLAADRLTAIMLMVAAVMALAVSIYSIRFIDGRREAFGYHPLYQVLLMGVNAAFLTGDMFNLYVSFEIMLMSSFVLMSLGGERGQTEGAIKYVSLNLLASVFFLAGAGILYGVAGTLNFADLSVKLASETLPPELQSVVAVLFLAAFGVKAALFPLFFWLPASYHTPPAPVSAIFAGLLTKVGVYALLRVFTLIFVHDPDFIHALLLGLAVATMVTGVLGAAVQNDIRRILSFHIISQIGYMVLGLGLLVFRPVDGPIPEGVRLGLAGSIFYLMHHIVVKTNLFLVGGVVERLRGTGRLDRLGGLYRERIGLAALFLIPALSLAGIPPLSGFWAKFALVKAGLELGAYVAVAAALGVGLLTLYSMTKIWAAAFWAPAANQTPRPSPPGLAWQFAPMIALAAITVLIGIAAGPLFDLSLGAADQLLDPSEYIRAVLGSEAAP